MLTQFSFHPLRGFVSALSAILMLGTVTGCATKTPAMFVDREVGVYLAALERPYAYPVARKVTWKFLHAGQLGGNAESWFVTDGKLIKNRAQIEGLDWLATQQVTASANLSDVFHQKAQEATKQDRHQEALRYHEMSESALQRQIAYERTAANLAFAQALVNVGRSLIDSMVASRGADVVRYVSQDMGAIGEKAPEGSVLEIVMKSDLENYTDSIKPLDSRSTLEVVVTLKDEHGKIWRSSAGYRVNIKFFESPEAVAKPSILGNNVQMNIDTFLPIGKEGEFREAGRRILEFAKKLAPNTGQVELLVPTAAAVAGIYDEIELSKARRRD